MAISMTRTVFLLLVSLNYIGCQNTFYKTFLKWQLKSKQHMDFDHCFALNFGFGSSLEIPTFSMQAFSGHVDQNETEEMLLNREMLTSASEECILVFVGEQFLEKIDDITKIVKKLSREVGTRPTALFVNAKQKNNVISTNILFYPLVSLKVKCLFCFEFGLFLGCI